MSRWATFRRTLARIIAPAPRMAARMYANARPSRLSGGYVLNSSADMELVQGLQNLRGRSRQLVRDASYAKRAKRVIQDNVIGTGIGTQCRIKNTRNELHKVLNDAVEKALKAWACSDGFHTGGQLHLADMERLLIGEVFEAGEIFVRKHRRKFGSSNIPLALEIIEPERIADNIQHSPRYPGNTVRMGIEVDEFYRPVGYYVRKRFMGEIGLGLNTTDSVEFIPASDMIHLRLLDRFPQTRGEPWMHTVIRRLQDMDGYSEAEIVAARAASAYFGAIKSPENPNPSIEEKQEDGQLQTAVEAGIIMKLAPGEEMEFFSPNRPNSAMDPFMRLMLREVAAGVGTSYESLSRDYAQSNYSSSRLALLEDRDLWRTLQGWFIRQFRADVHREFLMMATLAGEIQGLTPEMYGNDMERYSEVAFKPRGWSWIDPTKEVEAYKAAVRAGFTTVTDVISKTADGRDMEDMLEERAQELKDMRAVVLSAEGEEEVKGIEFDTDPNRKADGSPIGLTAEQQMEQQEKAEAAKAEQAKANMEALKQGAGAKEKDAVAAEKKAEADRTALVEAIRQQKPPQVLVSSPNVNVAPAAVTVNAGDVTVEPQSITLKPSDVRVDVQPSPAPSVHVEAPNVNVASPNVNVAPAEVRVDNHVSPTPINVAPSSAEVRVENRVDVPAPNVTVSPAQVTVENKITSPEPKVDVRVENKVETPKVDVSVAAPDVRVTNNVEVPQVKETVQEVETDHDGNVRRVRTRTVR